MKTQKRRNDEGHKGGDKFAPKSHKMKKNMQRLGGGSAALSLEAFANAKSNNTAYNPAILKKKREFYKNAKYVNKYKKMVNQQEHQKDPSSSVQPLLENNSEDASYTHNKNKKGSFSLHKLYEKKHQELEKERMEREAIIKAKKEEKEKYEAQRKALKKNMFKKTRKGQPVMKYRIEHILETL